MSKQVRLTHKIVISIFFSGILTLSACGSSSEDTDSKTQSEKQTCETVKTIRADIEQTKIDVANGELDLGEAVVEIAMIQARIELVQESAPEGELKETIDRWAVSRQQIMDSLDDENEVDQLKPENDAAADALDKLCE